MYRTYPGYALGNKVFPRIGSNPSSTNLRVARKRVKGDSFVNSLTVVSTSAAVSRTLKHHGENGVTVVSTHSTRQDEDGNPQQYDEYAEQ